MKTATTASPNKLIIFIFVAPLYVLYIVGKELVIVGSIGALLFTGRRGINYRAVLDPIHNGPSSIWRCARASFWFVDRYGAERTGPLLVLNPPVIAASFIVEWIILYLYEGFADNHSIGQLATLWSSEWWVYIVGATAPVMIYIVLFVGGGIATLVTAAIKDRRRQARGPTFPAGDPTDPPTGAALSR